MTSVGIDAMRTPAGKRTRTGVVKVFFRLPAPSWPWVPRPQAYRRPLVSSAYCVELELPTWAIMPGRVTLTGDFCVPKLPLRPPKKDPQCSATEVTGRTSAIFACCACADPQATMRTAMAAAAPALGATGSDFRTADHGAVPVRSMGAP